MSLGIGFRPAFLDFQRGIHVGNLEDNQRITRILKLALEQRYGQPFVTERYGRGVYWQWIGYLNRANREAKPVSSDVSFGCSKFFLTVDTEAREFQCGMQVERGYIKASRDRKSFVLREDWDWHRLIRSLKPGGAMDRELRRLLGEGFQVHAGSWGGEHTHFRAADYPGATKLRRALEAAPKDLWAGFQIYYPMTEDDVCAATGVDLVESMLAVFEEVTPAMDLTVQAKLGARVRRDR